MNAKQFISVFLILVGFIPCAGFAGTPKPSNTIAYPVGWQDWSTIAVSYRNDNSTIRAILGNPVAVAAARQGDTSPWPDGAILGKVVWKSQPLKNWQAADVPGELVHVEFMFKDSVQHKASQGWGWARWLGNSQTPFNEGSQSCVACHTPVKNRDWVFTDPAQIPVMPNTRAQAN